MKHFYVYVKLAIAAKDCDAARKVAQDMLDKGCDVPVLNEETDYVYGTKITKIAELPENN